MASAVSTSRFKTLPVKKKTKVSVKSFVEANKLSFKKGRGFYQLTKPEVIQEYKEVIVRRKSDGAFITGDKVRELLDIPKSSKKFTLDLDEIPDFDVFVQSTSVNRVLLPGTEFLYEVEDEAPATTKTTSTSGRAGTKRGRAADDEDTAEEDEPSPRKRAKRATPATKTTSTKASPAAKGKGAAKSTPATKGKGAKGMGAAKSTPASKGKAAVKSTPASKGKAAVKSTPAAKGKAATKSTPAAKGKGVTKATPTAKGKGAASAGRGTKRSAPSKTTEKDDEEAKPKPSPKKEPEPTASKKAKLDAPVPPGGPVEIVFSFDTTRSMYPCLTQVRRNISDTVKRLQKEIPGIRMAVIAHGDYCHSHIYITKILPFTTNVDEIVKFVETVQCTGGGDWEECYELVLHEARTKLSWTPGTQRSMVMIGDAIPHDPTYSMNTLKLDWKKEAKQLYDDLGVKIYSVQALNDSDSTSFYRSLADLTSGYHLHLDQFSSIVQFILAICFREQSMDQLQAYEDEVRSKGTGVNRSLHRLFDTLSGRGTTTYTGGSVGSDGLTPVNPSRFQVLDVDDRCDIRSFVQKNSLIFKSGRGFYEFTKAEKISDKKEVVLVDKVTGDMFTGPEACRVIGAGGSGKIKPTSLEKWRVFVQSTSYNRTLMPNTGFLYEVDPDH